MERGIVRGDPHELAAFFKGLHTAGDAGYPYKTEWEEALGTSPPFFSDHLKHLFGMTFYLHEKRKLSSQDSGAENDMTSTQSNKQPLDRLTGIYFAFYMGFSSLMGFLVLSKEG